MRTTSVVIALALASCTPAKSPEEEWGKAVESMPWLLKVLEACEAYKGSKSDADKRDIYVATQNMIRTVEVKDARGVVERIMPPAGEGGSYSLQLQVANQVRFATNAKEQKITRGTPLFDQIAGLKQDQCVIFSATKVQPMAAAELGNLCSPRYLASFTSIAPCPE